MDMNYGTVPEEDDQFEPGKVRSKRDCRVHPTGKAGHTSKRRHPYKKGDKSPRANQLNGSDYRTQKGYLPELLD